MVTMIPPIPEPPTPQDPPAQFNQKAAESWAGLFAAVPKMNQQALEIEQIGADADLAMSRAIAEAAAALGSRNEASASQIVATDQAAAALLSRQAAEAAAQQATNSADAWRFSMPELVKSTPGLLCLIKTGAGTLSIKAGTHVRVGSAYVSFSAQTAVQVPALTAGEDYSVWVKPDGSVAAVADPHSAPASPPAAGAVKIGGFHYGLVDPGTTVAGGGFATTGAGMIWTQADVDEIAGINAFSIWDLVYRPKCDPRGMTRSDAGFWFDIYFCGTEHITNGTSRYNTDVASGTVLPGKPLIFGGNGAAKYTALTWYEANEIALSHGKRLMSYQEFAAAAYGVTENQSLGGAASTIPGTLRQAGYTSKPGGEQMSGNHYTWGAAAHGVGGSAWVSGAERGQTYGTPYGALFGGARDNAALSGSRASSWNFAPWNSYWGVGLRAACDHYQGGY